MRHLLPLALLLLAGCPRATPVPPAVTPVAPGPTRKEPVGPPTGPSPGLPRELPPEALAAEPGEPVALPDRPGWAGARPASIGELSADSSGPEGAARGPHGDPRETKAGLSPGPDLVRVDGWLAAESDGWGKLLVDFRDYLVDTPIRPGRVCLVRWLDPAKQPKATGKWVLVLGRVRSTPNVHVEVEDVHVTTREHR